MSRKLAILPLAAMLFSAACGELEPTSLDMRDAVRFDVSPSSLAGSTGFTSNIISSAAISIMSDIQFTRTVYRTDYVSAGVGGLRNAPTGTIELAGLSGAVTRATLYWHSVANTTDPLAGQTVSVNGTPVTGIHLGFSSDNCWGFANSQAWAADVTALVQATGNGNYVLTDFSGYPTVNPNGASLVVFYNDGDPTNDRDAVIFEGNDSNIDNPYDAPGWNVTLAGINYTSGNANLQLHVSDGQQFQDDALILNGLVLEPAGIIFGGFSVPGANDGPTNNGRLWDIRTWDVTSWLSPGENTLVLTTGVASDCLALVVAIVDLPAGAAPDQPPPPADDDEVTIDIKPGSDPNSIRLTGNGDARIAVAILGTATFDALQVDPATARLGTTSVAKRNNGTLFASAEDVNGDGRPDLVLHFERSQLISNGDLTAATTSLTLHAATFGGVSVHGSDAVRVVN
jgi:hypothetical protein